MEEREREREEERAKKNIVKRFEKIFVFTSSIVYALKAEQGENALKPTQLKADEIRPQFQRTCQDGTDGSFCSILSI